MTHRFAYYHWNSPQIYRKEYTKTTTVLKSYEQRLTLITIWGQMIENSDAYISVDMPILFPIWYIVLLSKEWHILLCHSLLLFTLLNLFAACFATRQLCKFWVVLVTFWIWENSKYGCLRKFSVSERLILWSIYCQLAESLVKWQSHY